MEQNSKAKRLGATGSGIVGVEVESTHGDDDANSRSKIADMIENGSMQLEMVGEWAEY